MAFSWQSQPRPILALSPMADMTDTAFNKTVRRVISNSANNSRLIIFREMISAEAIARENIKTLEMAMIENPERPVVQQIFGSNPNSMAKCAQIIMQKFAPEAIDINMGCPVYKMVSNFNGAALMKDSALASKIVREVKNAVGVPVSVKMRSGWSSHEECIEFSKIIEDAGADLITVHGRTQKQGYSGVANREVVSRVKSQLKIPVLYNGDIFSAQDYFNALDETHCDGALIARGALGNPWIFLQIEQMLNGNEITKISIADRITTVLFHLDEHIKEHSEQSVPTFRKHLGWYFKGVSGFRTYKQALMSATEKQEITAILNDFLANAARNP